MADISKMTLPNGSSYDLKDATARAGLAGKAEASHTHSYYATCATGRSTAIKVATLENFTLFVGATVVVTFTGTGSSDPLYGQLKLNVNNTGDIPIVCSRYGIKYNIIADSGSAFYNNATHIFIYDGTYWICMDWDDVSRKARSVAGTNSYAEGSSVTASGDYTHAEGSGTTASGRYSHAEGDGTTASGDYSHAEGGHTTASGSYSHAECDNATASGWYSHAEGAYTTASGDRSHAEGGYTTASNQCSHAGGHYNASMTNGGRVTNTTGTAFVIGNGTASDALSNAFSVMFNGTVKAMSTITASTTADYAEFFEWLDENPDGEDRVGYFVTMDGDKIRIANADDNYILGVVSGEPFVLGNGDCDTWNGMFLHDEFRRTIYEPAPKMEEILDDEGNPTGEFEEIEGVFEGIRPKLNPEYDHTKTYISRFDRPEWSPVGMLGVLAVRHDGTAKVNGYITIADGGIATACDKNAENSYRVIKANTDSVVEIIFR